MAGRPAFFSPFALVRRKGLHKGLLGGSRGWLAAGAVVYGGRALRTMVRRTEQLAATEKLSPGESITIRAITPPTRAERKAQRRAAKRSR